MTLAEYVRRRNGVPLGAPGSLGNMLRRSFGAPSFEGFWRHWNPIWSYGLGRFVYGPVRRRLPAAVAVLATFAVSGLLHDAAATLVHRGAVFVTTPWFLLVGLGVVLGRWFGMDLSGAPPWARGAAHLTWIGACLALALQL